MNSPRLQHGQHQQQAIILKQQDLHPSQILHVVSSNTSAPSLTSNKASAVIPPPSALHTVPQTTTTAQPYGSYIQQTQAIPSQQQQSPMMAAQKPSASPLVLPPSLMGLSTHSAMVIQAKTTLPTQSSSGSSPTIAHLQHSSSQHTSSPPLQSQHLSKTPSNPMLHTLQSQGTSAHVINAVASPPPAPVKSLPQQQTTISTNVGGKY